MRSVATYIRVVFSFSLLVLLIPLGARAQTDHAHDHPEMDPVEGQLRAEYMIQARFDPRTKRIHGVVEIASRDTTLWGSAALELSVPERGTTFDSVFYRGRLLDSVSVPFRGGQTVLNLADTVQGPQPLYLRIVYSCPWILHGWESDKPGVMSQVPFSRWCPQLQFKQPVSDARESYRAAITVDRQYSLNSSAELLNEADHYGRPGRGDGITRALQTYEGNWDSDDRLYMFRAERVTDFSLVWSRGMVLDRVRVGDIQLHLLYPQDSDSDRYDNFLTAYDKLFRYMQTRLGEPKQKYVSTVVFTDVDQLSLSPDGILTMPDRGRPDMELLLLSAYNLVGDRLSHEGLHVTGNDSFPLVGRRRSTVYSRDVSLLEALQGYYLTDLIEREYGQPGLKALNSYLSERSRRDEIVTALVDGAARLRIMADAVGEDVLDVWIDSVLAIVAREEEPELLVHTVTDSLLGATGRSLWDQWSDRAWVCNYRLVSAGVVPGVSVLRATFDIKWVKHSASLRAPFELGLTYPNGDREIVPVDLPASEKINRFNVDIPVAGTKPEFVIIDPRGRLPLFNRETASHRLSYYHPYPPKTAGWYPAFEILVNRFTR